MKSLSKRRVSITCDKCGERISAAHMDELNELKMIHVYQFHTVDLAKNLIQSVPKAKALGEQIGAFMREYIKP